MAERTYAKNEADLEAFESDWRNLRTSALDNLAPSWKPIAEAEFDRRKSHYVTRIAANIRTQVEGETNATLRQAADTYGARAATAAHDDDAGELAETLRRFEAAISARTDLAPEEKAKARQDFQSGVATQVALGRFDRALKAGGLEAAATFAADFAASAAGGGDKLAEEWREPITRFPQARLADAPARLSAAIETARRDRQARTQAAARGAEAFAAGRPLDPAKAGADRDPARAIETARRTGILPDAARDELTDALIYGTPENRAEAAQALADLVEAAFGAFAGTDDKAFRSDGCRRGGTAIPSCGTSRSPGADGPPDAFPVSRRPAKGRGTDGGNQLKSV